MNINKKDKKDKKDKYDYILDIAERFNKCISLFIRHAQHKDPLNVDIAQVKRIITIGKGIDVTAVIRECWENIWEYRETIELRKLDIFDDDEIIEYTQVDTYQYKKHSQLIFNLLHFLRDGIKTLTQDEIDFLWSKADELVICVAEYKAIIEHGLDFYLDYKKQLDNKNI